MRNQGGRVSYEAMALLGVELRATHRKTCPFGTVPVLRDDFRELPDVSPQWVRPSVVVEVEYRQRTNAGLRHGALREFDPISCQGEVVQVPQMEGGLF